MKGVTSDLLRVVKRSDFAETCEERLLMPVMIVEVLKEVVKGPEEL